MSNDYDHFETRPASELDERKAWVTIIVHREDGTEEVTECTLVKALVVKKGDPNSVYGVFAGVTNIPIAEAMVHQVPALFPELKGRVHSIHITKEDKPSGEYN